MTSRKCALLAVVSIALATIVFGACDDDGESGPAALTVVVTSISDANERDSALTLREAMALVTGDLARAELSEEEAEDVRGEPTADSADVIGFDPAVFTKAQPPTIVLTDTLPPLKSGMDTIDGGGAGVIIDGNGKGFPCLVIDSSGNSIRGVEIQHCHTGIWLKAAGDNNVIGGPKEGQGNVLSANENVGIQIDGSANVVQGNFLGTDPTGTGTQPNGMEGIWIAPNATDNLIGGSSPGEGNIISGNSLFGINIGGAGATGNMVKGNLIGVDATGKKELQNLYGVVLSMGAKGNTIGGTSPGDANVISGNQSGGVLVRGPDTSDNLVIGNQIGTDASGAERLGNGTGIWLLDGAVHNKIGGPAEGEGNVIAHSGIVGVLVEGAGTTANAIRGNSVYSSAREGIVLKLDGNANLAAPSLTDASPVSGTACPGCVVDIYSDDSDEGKTYEGSTTADANGLFVFEGTPAGPFINATATDAEGNTSSFSQPQAVPSQ